MDKKKNEIIIFENQSVKLEVNMKDETVWLTLDQMTKLFGRDKSVISRHIKNIFEDNELKRDSVVANFATTASDGKTYHVDYYNLDVIISVGYRVKSKNGVLFRQWATKVIKDYMLKGYAINQKRLEYLEKTVQLIDIANRLDNELENGEARDVIKVIGKYYKALDLLEEYDNDKIKNKKGFSDSNIITYNDCRNVIDNLKYSKTSEIFGKERGDLFKGILGNIYQSFAGQDVYPTIQEKGANLLYLLIKDHPFTDGNKRIAATMFIYFLNFYGMLYKDGAEIIDNKTLAALTLLIAESNPKEKNVIIDLVMNYMNE